MSKTKVCELYSQMFTEYPDIVNVSQLGKMLGYSRNVIYDLIGGGYLAGIKIGNSYRVPKVSVIDFVLSKYGKEACCG